MTLNPRSVEALAHLRQGLHRYQQGDLRPSRANLDTAMTCVQTLAATGVLSKTSCRLPTDRQGMIDPTSPNYDVGFALGSFLEEWQEGAWADAALAPALGLLMTHVQRLLDHVASGATAGSSTDTAEATMIAAHRCLGCGVDLAPRRWGAAAPPTYLEWWCGSWWDHPPVDEPEGHTMVLLAPSDAFVQEVHSSGASPQPGRHASLPAGPGKAS